MKLSLYIAKRYLLAKKSRNAINVISSISVAGVTVGTMALIIVLSVFNGLESLVRSIFNTFDPDLKITPVSGKTFIPDSASLSLLSNVNGVACYSLCVEENALLMYGSRQTVAFRKTGVSGPVSIPLSGSRTLSLSGPVSVAVDAAN